MIKFSNTLTRQIENFEPLNQDIITIYSCGPTVYDRAHIGNLSSFIYADILRRALEKSYPDKKITHVMNITDVDDKTIKRSQEEYPDLEPMEALSKLTLHYEDLFMQDLHDVGVDTNAITFIRATNSIHDMQELIRSLINSGIAYINNEGVYFSINKYKESGKKYGQLIEITDDNTSEERIDNDEYDKDNVHDFALWKVKKDNEPSWDFEVESGNNMPGRPGWHIECSAMSVKLLGQPFDIHTGGTDLKFPHHENEIAQSTAIGDSNKLANYFMHSEHLLVEGNKMSKSLNNFITLENIIEKGIDPLAFRLLVLEGHYKSQRNFSWDILESAARRLSGYRNASELVWQSLDIPSKEISSFSSSIDTILGRLQDDINTSLTLASLSSFLDVIKADLLSKLDVNAFKEFLSTIDHLLGLDLSAASDITEDQKQKIKEREEARANNDWGKSDAIRDELKNAGLEINDNDKGTTWYRAYQA